MSSRKMLLPHRARVAQDLAMTAHSAYPDSTSAVMQYLSTAKEKVSETLGKVWKVMFPPSYLSVGTRPDLKFTVRPLGEFPVFKVPEPVRIETGTAAPTPGRFTAELKRTREQDLLAGNLWEKRLRGDKEDIGEKQKVPFWKKTGGWKPEPPLWKRCRFPPGKVPVYGQEDVGVVNHEENLTDFKNTTEGALGDVAHEEGSNQSLEHRNKEEENKQRLEHRNKEEENKQHLEHRSKGPVEETNPVEEGKPTEESSEHRENPTTELPEEIENPFALPGKETEKTPTHIVNPPCAEPTLSTEKPTELKNPFALPSKETETTPPPIANPFNAESAPNGVLSQRSDSKESTPSFNHDSEPQNPFTSMNTAHVEEPKFRFGGNLVAPTNEPQGNVLQISTGQNPSAFPATHFPFPASNSAFPAPFPANNTPFPTNNTPFPANNTPFPANNTPFPTNNTPFPTNNTPFPTNNTPFPASSTAFPANSPDFSCFPAPTGVPGPSHPSTGAPAHFESVALGFQPTANPQPGSFRLGPVQSRRVLRGKRP